MIGIERGDLLHEEELQFTERRAAYVGQMHLNTLNELTFERCIKRLEVNRTEGYAGHTERVHSSCELWTIDPRGSEELEGQCVAYANRGRAKFAEDARSRIEECCFRVGDMR